nr:chemotaxis protein CheX [uncultured Desulfuromonas sp.]
MQEFDQILQEKITSVLAETLENMAFLDVDDSSEEEIAELDTKNLSVTLMITKPILMEMRLEMDQELLLQVVETVYTMDREDITEQQVEDLLAEFLNTLAGRFMTELLPADQTFSLNLPEINNDDDSDFSEMDSHSFYYLADELPVIVELTAANADKLAEILSGS